MPSQIKMAIIMATPQTKATCPRFRLPVSTATCTEPQPKKMRMNVPSISAAARASAEGCGCIRRLFSLDSARSGYDLGLFNERAVEFAMKKSHYNGIVHRQSLKSGFRGRGRYSDP